LPEASKHENRPITIALISGSLRARSVNGAVVETAAKLVPAGVRAVIYRPWNDLSSFHGARRDAISQSILARARQSR
jgi:NAD(P)H-dependent FMN reductase